MEIFLNCMSRLHCQHLRYDIDQYLKSVDAEMDSTTQKDEITTQKKILDFLKINPKATRVEIAQALGDITADGVKFIIAKLQQKGLLKRVGGRKHGEWVVCHDDNNTK